MSKTYIKIANAHIEAKDNDSFTHDSPESKEQLREALLNGDTFRGLYEAIDLRFVSMTSTMVSAIFQHRTEASKRGIRKGFKEVCDSLGIK